jgi:hypothetical protein
MVTKTQCTFAGTSKGQEVARIRCFWYACSKQYFFVSVFNRI